MSLNQSMEENCVKSFFRELAKLTNRLHCNSNGEVLINGLPVMMKPIGQIEFNIKNIQNGIKLTLN